jgi:hypothetical protein
LGIKADKANVFIKIRRLLLQQKKFEQEHVNNPELFSITGRNKCSPMMMFSVILSPRSTCSPLTANLEISVIIFKSFLMVGQECMGRS